MSARRNQSVVLRLMRAEYLELISREIWVAAAELSAWCDAFPAAGGAGLNTSPAGRRDAEMSRLTTKVGELTMADDLLDAKIKMHRPLARIGRRGHQPAAFALHEYGSPAPRSARCSSDGTPERPGPRAGLAPDGDRRPASDEQA